MVPDVPQVAEKQDGGRGRRGALEPFASIIMSRKGGLGGIAGTAKYSRIVAPTIPSRTHLYNAGRGWSARVTAGAEP